MSTVNLNKNSNLNPINTNSTSYSTSRALDEKAAAIAFQKMYLMMLEENSNNNSSDIFDSALMNQQLPTMDGGSQESDSALDALSILSRLSGSIRGGYSSIDSESQSYDNISSNTDNDINTPMDNSLGALSAKYESNGNPGTISNTAGDFGGKSYGVYQFSSKTGSLDSFIQWLKGSNSIYYEKLSNAKAADGNHFSVNFDNAWKDIASNDKTEFFNLQQNYIKSAFYDSAADKLKNRYNFDINTKSDALKNVLWSTAVQHGVNGAVSIFAKADLTGKDSTIISQVYNERQKVNVYFRGSSKDIQESVFKRFIHEKNEALSELNTKV